MSIFKPLSCVFTQIRTCKTKSKGVIIPKAEVQRFVECCAIAAGASKENACYLGLILAAADEKGFRTHGVNRLEIYLNDIKKCLVNGKATPEIVKEGPATAWVDGKNALGAVVGYFCVKLAIKKAEEVGVGWVAANNSTHYGIASVYTIPMMKKGLIGFTCTNTSSIMAPFGSKEAALGSNPLSLAAPGADGDSFVFDMATTAVAKGKIEQALREGKKLPVGWVQDSEGKPMTDAKEALASGNLLPLGGTLEGAKGTGLAILVEVFTGILAGANYGPRIPKWGKTEEKSNLGQCFVAINPKSFAPCFEERMSDLLSSLRKLEPVNPERKMMVAGDPEKLRMKKVADQGGIEYTEEDKKRFDALAKELGMKPMKACG